MKPNNASTQTTAPHAPRPRGGIAPHKYGFVITASIDGKQTYLGFRKTREDAEAALNHWRDTGRMPAKPERVRTTRAAATPSNPRPGKRVRTATMSSQLSPRGKKGSRALPGDNDAVKRARAKLAAASLKTTAAEMEALADDV